MVRHLPNRKARGANLNYEITNLNQVNARMFAHVSVKIDWLHVKGILPPVLSNLDKFCY
jgi:hypothetical protein